MRKNNLSILTSILILGGVLSTQATAADLTASSGTPMVTFHDAGVNGSDTDVWKILGDDYSLQIKDKDAGDIVHILPSTNNDNSINIDTDGKVSLAGESVSITRAKTTSELGPTMKMVNPNSVSINDESASLDWFLDTTGAGGDKNKVFNIAYDLNTVGVISKIPFTILGNANDNSVYMNSNGIGILNGDPKAALDVAGTINSNNAVSVAYTGEMSGGWAKLFNISANNTLSDKKSDALFVIENKREGFAWEMRTWEPNGGYAINKIDSGVKEMIITAADSTDGVQLLMGDGGKYSNGQWLDASSRAYKENIEVLDTKTALEAFHKLQPVTYNYKTQKDESIVGFIAEDVPSLVAVKDKNALSALEMVALLTKVVQEQDKNLKTQAEKIAKLEKMQKRLTRVESLLTNLALDTSTTDKEKVSMK